jgi:hypothetical protein
MSGPIFGRPSGEEERRGFRDLPRLPIACWVVASDFVPPIYLCGGWEDESARSYVTEFLSGDFRLAQSVRALAFRKHQRRFFSVGVRHEKLDEWKTIRLCAGLTLSVSVEANGSEEEDPVPAALRRAGSAIAVGPCGGELDPDELFPGCGDEVYNGRSDKEGDD